MDKLKQWIALTVAGVLVLVAGGWFLLVSPKRSEAADLRLQAEQQVSANSLLANRIQMLKEQAKQLPQQQARLAAVAAKIPDNPALPALIRALTGAADEAGVELVSLAPSAPTLVESAAAAAPVTAAAAEPGTTASSTNAKRSATATPTAMAGQLQSIALAVNVVGGYFQVQQFLDRVENLSRAMKVSGLSVVPGTNPVKPATSQPSAETGKVLSATITSAVYMATGRTTVAPVGK